MPNRDTHTLAGIVVGGGVALLHERVWQRPGDQVAFLAGAAVGGALGGRLPDMIEPATRFDHRQVAHAILPVWLIMAAANEGIAQTVEWLLASADAEPSYVQRLGYFFLAGAVKAMPPAYVSHLALDACTPSCLPLIGCLN